MTISNFLSRHPGQDLASPEWNISYFLSKQGIIEQYRHLLSSQETTYSSKESSTKNSTARSSCSNMAINRWNRKVRTCTSTTTPTTKSETNASSETCGANRSTMRWPPIYFKGLTHSYYFVCINVNIFSRA